MYKYNEKSQKVNIFFQQKECRQFLPPAKAGGFPCRTNMKNNYAAKNGLQLLRIPYTGINNISKILTPYILC